MKCTIRFALLFAVLGTMTLSGEFASAQSSEPKPERRGLPMRPLRPLRAGEPGQRPEKLERRRAEGTKPLSRSPEEMARMREAAQERMKQARERMLTMSPEEREQMRQKHRDSRDARREASAERLKMRWGNSLRKSEVQEELKTHAVRMAQLQRIKALAEDNDKPEVLDRAIAAMRKEQLRHGATMAKIARPAALETRRPKADHQGPAHPGKPPAEMPMPGQVRDNQEAP